MAHLLCSFCGKREYEVKKLIAGGGSNRPFICDECVTLSKKIIDGEVAGTPRPQSQTRRNSLLDRLRGMAVTLPGA